MGSKILPATFPDLETPKNISISEFLYRCDQDPHDVYNKCLSTGIEYTRGEALKQAKCFGKALRTNQSLNLKPGDIVGLFIPSVPEYFSLVLGLCENGIIAALLNPDFTKDETRDVLEDIDAKVIICLPESLEKLQGFVGTTSVQGIITLGKSDNTKFLNYFHLVDNNRGSVSDHEDKPEVKGTDTAVIILSSGTTGRPKGIELTHANLIETVAVFANNENLCFGRDLMFTPLVMFNSYGFCMAVLVPFLANCKVLTVRKFSSDVFISGIKDYKPTFLAVVPSLLSFIASRPELSRKDFKSIRTIMFGGAVGGPGLIESVRKKIGDDIFLQATYAMTECLPSTITPVHLRSIAEATGSVGVATSNIQIKVIDSETGKLLGPNEVGEICVKSSRFTNRYYRKPEETAKLLDAEGWLHTGDVGYYTQQYNLFYISARIKDLIKVSGHQVSPDEIEDVIKKMDKVGNIAVFGIPHEKYGEVPRACVVRADESLTADEIHSFIKDKLSHYKHLKGGIQFIPELPLNSNGKVLRRHLREQFSEE